ncbi:MAG: hypothetical protein NC396_07265 [Bacteroides sp.]|nr:hypothetical protein [Bacteroides sp.]MCM1086246.1 hypothetical protein [Bacteroides sp.]
MRLRFILLLACAGLPLPLPAQDDCLLPFSLQASLGKSPPHSALSGIYPALGSMYPQQTPQLAYGAYCRSAFIKENGHSGLSVQAGNNKDCWNLLYDYHGYRVLHRQQIGLSYGRNLLSGLGIGLFSALRLSNPIEDRKAEMLLDIGLSAAFKRGIWAVAFDARQSVPLRSHLKKEWNHALCLRVGAGCNIYRNLHIGLDIYKDLRYPLQGGLSFAYAIETPRSREQRFIVYAQARVNPAAYKLGLAYTGRRVQAGISASYQNPVGFETCVEITVHHLFAPKS